jgi:hypothetical protein
MTVYSCYQSHECAGYRARITIEVFAPDDVDFDLAGGRKGKAEDIADAILAFAGPKTRDIVQVMRGYTSCSVTSDKGAKP